MKHKFTESFVILTSLFKWFVLASVTGAIAGLSTVLFLRTLRVSISFASSYRYYFLLLPLAFWASRRIIKRFAFDAEGHGTEKVIEAVHKQSGRIPFAVVPVKFVATVITVALGGSAGKEGPAAQIGGGLASKLADILKLDDYDRRKLVICGLSAGFSAVFGTPIAGAIFGIEVLFIGSMLYDVLFPSFVAGIISYHVSHGLGSGFIQSGLVFVPEISGFFFLKAALAGLFFGACAFLLAEVMMVLRNFYRTVKLSAPVKNLLGGAAVAALALIFSTRYLGLGQDTIIYALEGGRIVWYAFLLKILFTGITLNFGGSGGIVTPVFFVGATAGAAFGSLFGLDSATFAAIGMVALLSGAANTPIAASIMAVELFGPQIAPYASIACAVSFFMTGHRSVYPSQILSMRKSASLHVETGEEVEKAVSVYRPKGRAAGGIRKILRRGSDKDKRSDGMARPA